jgi:hypothetical protein
LETFNLGGARFRAAAKNQNIIFGDSGAAQTAKLGLLPLEFFFLLLKFPLLDFDLRSAQFLT